MSAGTGAPGPHRVLVGATGSGKKRLAAALAERHGLTVLSMDSMKVHRGMDIGTDKPDAALRARVPFGLIDLVGHDEDYSAGRWIARARRAVADSPRPVLFAGGTPLYLRLLLEGLFEGPPVDPDVRARLERLWDERGEAEVRARLARADPQAEARLRPRDRKRLLRALEVLEQTGRPLTVWQREATRRPIPGRFVVAALRVEPAAHEHRLAARVRRMVARGLVAETAALRARGPFAREPARAIGYAEALEHLAGRLDEEAMVERIVARTRRLVRKQSTFLRSFEDVRWLDVGAETPFEALLARAGCALELEAAR